ncbi:hemerythrin domain-containing protein [Piscinibacter sp.]|jgi:hemerythrin-like domain-containing protein|uniref:hemerythrin domain-containing protein n=1 Tax=Piscinibacter sp. TaxID=1903157 RepID=UPI00355A1C5D
MNAMPTAAAASLHATATGDGFAALDACHQQTLMLLDELSDLVARVEQGNIDAATRERAGVIAKFFSTTAREHHEDEERHVFPPLVATANPEVIQAVLRLQQDHGWLEEDWFELAPHVQAVAGGYNWYDIDMLREGVAVFSALYHDHIELEESFIYPEAQARMPVGERREMGREMAARHRAERAARRTR